MGIKTFEEIFKELEKRKLEILDIEGISDEEWEQWLCDEHNKQNDKSE